MNVEKQDLRLQTLAKLDSSIEALHFEFLKKELIDELKDLPPTDKKKFTRVLSKEQADQMQKNLRAVAS